MLLLWNMVTFAVGVNVATLVLALLSAPVGATVTKEDIMKHLVNHVAKWWLPDDIVFTEDMPHTATGKILKTELRTRYKDHVWSAQQHAHHGHKSSSK